MSKGKRDLTKCAPDALHVNLEIQMSRHESVPTSGHHNTGLPA